MAMSGTPEGETYESESYEGAADEAVQEPQLIELIREHPWVSVLGAAALGFVLARLVRRER
jgi:ElaB/YqjD/DUF883 family membrane-anchored ribosome-binding protein